MKLLRKFLNDYALQFPPNHSNSPGSMASSANYLDTAANNNFMSFSQQASSDLGLDRIDTWTYESGVCLKASQTDLDLYGSAGYVLYYIERIT